MIQLILFLVVLVLFVAWNYYTIKVEQRTVDHALQQVYRTSIWVLLSVMIEIDWRDKIMYFVAYHFAFGLPFDLLLNKMTGREWLYIGSTALTDRLGRKWPGAFWPLKFILFLIGMGTLIFGTYW